MSKSGRLAVGRAAFQGRAPVFLLYSVNFAWGRMVRDGGPDRTRTYDPRLIKAVL